MVTFEESLDPDLKEEISIEARKFGILNGIIFIYKCYYTISLFN
jgi:hypothetical protein